MLSPGDTLLCLFSPTCMLRTLHITFPHSPLLMIRSQWRLADFIRVYTVPPQSTPKVVYLGWASLTCWEFQRPLRNQPLWGQWWTPVCMLQVIQVIKVWILINGSISQLHLIQGRVFKCPMYFTDLEALSAIHLEYLCLIDLTV